MTNRSNNKIQYFQEHFVLLSGLVSPGVQPIYIYLVRELCSARSQMVNISGFVGHRVSIVTTRLRRCRESIHKQYGKA